MPATSEQKTLSAAAEALARALSDTLPASARRVGIAVSGGGDSMALLALLVDWATPHGVEVFAASVDHGLRPEAAQEISLAARLAAELGVAHSVLNWRWDGQGNLQAAARDGRRTALRDWALRHGIAHVCLGHTRDDQAETVLLRLARGSGVDGLAAMAVAARDAGNITWLRPLLAVGRADLRTVIAARGLTFAEDPSNCDPRFDRVKARALLADETLPGLRAERLAETAARMAAARSVLGRVAFAAAERILRVEHGAVRLALPDYAELADDTRWRILAACLCRVPGKPLRPRLAALRAAEALALSGRRATLHGTILRRASAALWIHREPASVAAARGRAPGVWDGRWSVDRIAHAQTDDACHLAALGPAGLAARPDWRRAGIPRLSLLTSPAIWRAGKLEAAPLLDPALGRRGPWRAQPLWDTIAVCRDLLSD